MGRQRSVWRGVIVRRGVIVIGGMVLTIGLAMTAAIAGAAQKTPVATDGWVKAAAADATATDAFAVIDNPTAYLVYVMSASTDVAERVEFRDGSKNDAVVKTIEIPSFESLGMEPKGVHLHLVGLKRPLKEGEEVSLTLVTEASLQIPVAAVVRKE